MYVAVFYYYHRSGVFIYLQGRNTLPECAVSANTASFLHSGKCLSARAVCQAVGHRPLTAGSKIRSQESPCDIRGGGSGS